MLKEGHTDAEIIDFVKEMEMMKMIGKHVNIINLLGVCTQPAGHPLLVIVEFAEHGNLRDFLRARRPELVQYLGRQGDRHVSLRDMLSFGWQVLRDMGIVTLTHVESNNAGCKRNGVPTQQEVCSQRSCCKECPGCS